MPNCWPSTCGSASAAKCSRSRPRPAATLRRPTDRPGRCLTGRTGQRFRHQHGQGRATESQLRTGPPGLSQEMSTVTTSPRRARCATGCASGLNQPPHEVFMALWLDAQTACSRPTNCLPGRLTQTSGLPRAKSSRQHWRTMPPPSSRPQPPVRRGRTIKRRRNAHPLVEGSRWPWSMSVSSTISSSPAMPRPRLPSADCYKKQNPLIPLRTSVILRAFF